MIIKSEKAKHMGPVQQWKPFKWGAVSKLLMECVTLIPWWGHQSAAVSEGVWHLTASNTRQGVGKCTKGAERKTIWIAACAISNLQSLSYFLPALLWLSPYLPLYLFIKSFFLVLSWLSVLTSVCESYRSHLFSAAVLLTCYWSLALPHHTPPGLLLQHGPVKLKIPSRT